MNSFVNRSSGLPDDDNRPESRPAFVRWMGSANAITQLFLSASARPDLINLCGGLPAPEVYPRDEFPSLTSAVTQRWGHRPLGYAPIEGIPELREALARRYSTPQLRLSAENVIITTGSMQALDLIGKILLAPKDTILAHYPTYLGALDAWRPREPLYHELPLERIQIDALPSLRIDDAKFVYTVPNFSNPTGFLVSRDMRAALVDGAIRANTWLVEDDPYGALFYDDAPFPRILDLSAEHEHGERYGGPVVYLGTMSKTFVPGIRIGWTIAAPEMIKALTLAKQSTDLCTSAFCQFVALQALETGLVDRLIPKILALYKSRRDALCEAVHAHLDPYFDWVEPRGGMFVWLSAKDPAIDTDRLFHAALDAGVAFTPSSAFDSNERNKRAMRINFTLNPPAVLREGVARLGRVVHRSIAESQERLQ